MTLENHLLKAIEILEEESQQELSSTEQKRYEMAQEICHTFLCYFSEEGTTTEQEQLLKRLEKNT